MLLERTRTRTRTHTFTQRSKSAVGLSSPVRSGLPGSARLVRLPQRGTLVSICIYFREDCI